MNLSRSSEENSESGGFTEYLPEPDSEGFPVEDEPVISNYLIEKVSQRLEEQDGADASREIADLLVEYRELLAQDAEEALGRYRTYG